MSQHCTLEDLLAIRDGEGPFAARRHLERGRGAVLISAGTAVTLAFRPAFESAAATWSRDAPKTRSTVMTSVVGAFIDWPVYSA